MATAKMDENVSFYHRPKDQQSEFFQTQGSNIFKMSIQVVNNSTQPLPVEVPPVPETHNVDTPVTNTSVSLHKIGPLPLGRKAVNENALKTPNVDKDDSEDLSESVETTKSRQTVAENKSMNEHNQSPIEPKNSSGKQNIKSQRGRPLGSKNVPKSANISDDSQIFFDLPENCSISKNLSVDIYLPLNLEGLKLEPQMTRDIFSEARKYHCDSCPRKFSKSNFLRVHERKNTCVPPDSPYHCTVCQRRFLGFSHLQMHWKLNHNRQKMV